MGVTLIANVVLKKESPWKCLIDWPFCLFKNEEKSLWSKLEGNLVNNRSRIIGHLWKITNRECQTFVILEEKLKIKQKSF